MYTYAITKFQIWQYEYFFFFLEKSAGCAHGTGTGTEDIHGKIVRRAVEGGDEYGWSIETSALFLRNIKPSIIFYDSLASFYIFLAR